MKRLISMLLLLAMLLSCLPVSVSADDTAITEAEEIVDAAPAEDADAEEPPEEEPLEEEIPTEEDAPLADAFAMPETLSENPEHFFYFSAEVKDKLLIAPVKIAYEAGQTIRQALDASPYSFETDSGDGFITAIENVTGNYGYASVPADMTLDKEASSVTHFRFVEERSSAISTGLQTLMQVMADYLYEDADVKSAAADAYQKALGSYLGIESDAAKACADAITKAITDYKGSLDNAYAVTFSGYTGGDYEISAENAFGKHYAAEADGTLSLPNGDYTFCIRKDNRSITGDLVVSGGAQTIRDLPALPDADWIDEESFAVSETSGYNEANYKPVELTGGAHTFTAVILDTFTGALYPYVSLSTQAPSGVSLSAIYTNTAGSEITSTVTDGSKREPLYGVLARGADGNEIVFRASAPSGSYTLHEELTLKLGRKPTLSALRIEGASGNKPAANESFSNQTFTYTYKVLSTEQSLKIYPTPTGSSYTVRVDGTELIDEYVSVPLDQTQDEQSITVLVSGGDYETAYTLIIQRGEGRRVTVTLAEDDMDIVMKNKNGEILQSRREAGNNYIYTLVMGETYTYYATKSTYYHVEKTFTLNESNVTFTVSIPQAQVPSLSALCLSLKSSLPIEALDLGKPFDAKTHSYAAIVPDTQGRFAVWADPADGASCTLRYNSITDTSSDGTQKVVQNIARTSAKGTELTNAILFGNVTGNTLTFTVSKTVAASGAESVTYSADYVVAIQRELTLSSLTAACGGVPAILHYEDSLTGFQPLQRTYEITVPGMATALELTLGVRDGTRYGETDSGYVLLVNDAEQQTDEPVQVALSGDSRTETVTITLTDRDGSAAASSYVLTVKKAAGTTAKFALTPADATLYIYETLSGVRIWPDETGKYSFSTGFTYCYSLTKYGYAGQSGAIQLTAGSGSKMTLQFGRMEKTDGAETFVPETSYSVGNTAISLKLTTAKTNPAIDPKIPAEWADFRGTAYDANGNMTGTANTNNGVTDAKIPFAAEDGTLYWASQVGKGYDEGAVGNPILVGGDLIAYAGTKIMKIDKDTGEILKEGTMAGTSSFAINNSTYAEGMILVGLSNGRIQAFNADTLESLWLYTDPLGGQPNCPITVSNGYAYTGFWNSEIKDASFVCLSLTDEVPASKLEAKAETWRYVQKGGFYWAGAYVCSDYILVGTDDGESGYTSATANLLLLDPKSGALLDSMGGFTGDIRCSICYDTATKAFYFDSKGGYFYRVRVQKGADGAWKLTDRAELSIGGMSTSTPVIANGRAYIGVSGKGQFTEYSGHSITVIDLSGLSIAYTAQTQGYPQTSGLLTTGYDNYNYVYFLDNYTPGKLRVLRDKAGQKEVNYTTIERVGEGKNEQTYTTAYALFTPAESQAQYCICSPIVDENGTLYFKNDSGYLMAYGSMVESLKLESSPTKTEYEAGEKFDPAGLKVTATYANGVKRDVTHLMKAADKALTQADTSVTLIYGLGQTMYHNVENTDKTMKPGEETASKSISIDIIVGNSTLTGTIGDLNWSFSAKTSKLTVSGSFPSGASLIAAVYTADGKMVGTKILTAEGEAELPTGAKIKLFLLDTNGKPLCQSATVKGA